MQYEFLQRKGNGEFWRAGHTLWGLVAAWNHATNPALFLSDREHARSALYARAIKARMARIGLAYGQDYKELSNGSLWPVKRWNHRVSPL